MKKATEIIRAIPAPESAVGVHQGEFLRPGIFVPRNLSAEGVLHFLCKIEEYDRRNQPEEPKQIK